MLVAGAAALGMLLGLVLGLLGGGGAILAVPALVYVLGLAPRAAVAASLAIVAGGALSGFVGHARSGRVAWGAAARFGAGGAVGSFVGAWLNQWLSGERLLALLGILMLGAAVSMVRRPAGTVATPRGSPFRAVFLGLGVGLLTGFFGVGGGFVIVPALTLGLGLALQHAVGTSLAIIAVNALAGLAGYLRSGDVAWPVTLVVTAGSVAGALAGSQLAGVVPERVLRRSFAVLVALIALLLIYRNAPSWLAFVSG